MSERTIDNWITILDPLGYGQAADVILNDLRDFPKAGEHREEDKKQLGNATRRLGHADNKSDRERVGLGCGQAAHPFAEFCYGRSTKSLSRGVGGA
jgi:hypothetical protein